MQMNRWLDSKSLSHIKQAWVSMHLGAWLWRWPHILGDRVRQNHLLLIQVNSWQEPVNLLCPLGLWALNTKVLRDSGHSLATVGQENTGSGPGQLRLHFWE